MPSNSIYYHSFHRFLEWFPFSYTVMTVPSIYRSSHAFLLWPQCSFYGHLMALYPISEENRPSCKFPQFLHLLLQTCLTILILLPESRTSLSYCLLSICSCFQFVLWASLTAPSNLFYHTHTYTHTIILLCIHKLPRILSFVYSLSFNLYFS